MQEQRQQLARKALRGDGGAFALLVESHKGLLYRTALSHMRNHADALDMVDEAVCRAYVSMHRLRDPEYFLTWLVRILINCCIDSLRRGKRIVVLDGAVAALPSCENAADEAVDLRAAVDDLPTLMRQIVHLKYFEDFTIQQVAAAMDMPVGTVKSYLHRALGKLRLQLSNGGDELS